MRLVSWIPFTLLGNAAGAIRIMVVLDIDAVAIARGHHVLVRADVELGICDRRAIAGGTAANVSRVRAQLNGAKSGEGESEHFAKVSIWCGGCRHTPHVERRQVLHNQHMPCIIIRQRWRLHARPVPSKRQFRKCPPRTPK